MLEFSFNFILNQIILDIKQIFKILKSDFILNFLKDSFYLTISFEKWKWGFWW